ncbi:MFS transporter [Jiangella endophytica]|uniref:MFS transporter n=1 Tax=Jiangella endophytica TaxID=1623398 RepID=UPI000E34A991|nr:MFS transporter [Jiangella endophytica]
MLAVGIEAQFAGTLAVYAPMFLIPQLHLRDGVGLAAATLVAAAPRFGSLLAIFGWGVLVDRFGERRVLAAGFALTVLGWLVALAAETVPELGAALVVVGLGASCVNSASGRVVAFWFPPRRRGLAMGIRQGSQPLGIAAAAAVVPALAAAHGTRAALAVPAAVCLLTAVLCAVAVVDPPRAAAGDDTVRSSPANPYRRDRSLPRLHLSSAMMMVPQIAIWTFAVLWLIETWSWSPARAGGLVAGCQVAGAVVRASAGAWSDRVGSRLRPMRFVAVASAVVMAALGLLGETELGIGLLVAASLVTLADNGLGVTAVAEAGGDRWGGRAIGVHSTGQLVVSSMAPSALEVVLRTGGYGWMFGLVAVLPLAAFWTLPIASETAGWGPRSVP